MCGPQADLPLSKHIGRPAGGGAIDQLNKMLRQLAWQPELATISVAPQDRELDPAKPDENARTPVTSP